MFGKWKEKMEYNIECLQKKYTYLHQDIREIHMLMNSEGRPDIVRWLEGVMRIDQMKSDIKSNTRAVRDRMYSSKYYDLVNMIENLKKFLAEFLMKLGEQKKVTKLECDLLIRILEGT